MLRRGAIVLAGAVFASACAAAGAWAAAPRIAFAQFTGQDSDVFTVGADGKDRQRVTTSADNDFEPDWSPDRKWIVFARTKAGTSKTRLFKVHPDKRGLKEIPHTGGAESPSWSRDGKLIAYIEHTPKHEAVFTIRPDGSHKTQVTSDNYDAAQPAWAPDGKRIAFGRSFNIWTIRPDGKRLERLAEGFEPDWAPDGKHIAYIGGPGDQADVLTMKPDGSGRRQWTSAADVAGFPAWAPNGKRIAFEKVTSQSTNIATVAFPGGGPATFVTGGFQPAW